MFRKMMMIAAIAVGALCVLIAGGTGVLYVANNGDYSVPATTADDPTLPYIELDGYRFHGEVFGSPDSPVVIVLHGGPGGDYRSILPLKALADDYQVVFYDQRGSGLSPRVPEEELTLDRYIADVDAIVEAYSPHAPVSVIGHSWGAMLAAAYIGRHPMKVSAAVLAEPGFFDEEHRKIYDKMTGLADLRPSPRVLAALACAWGESLHVDRIDGHARRDYLANRFFTTPMKDHPLAAYYPEDDLTNAAGESWRFGAAASAAIPKSGIDENGRLVDLAAGVESWTGEALFLSGSENGIIGPEYQAAQVARFTHGELAVIEGAGHTMIGEKPAESLAIIRGFLEG